ncbi:ribonuclease T1 [Nocardia sp. GAS34]|uniref:ribonuclease domain-containing protein n=1 Tax=unclassified Nocardia TaxID=2637762 RepID=UPI003D1C97D3
MSSKRLQSKAVASLAAVVLAGLTAMSVLLGGADAVRTPGITVAATQIQQVGCAIPDRAWQTLKLIDAGEWPPNDGSGTKGGTTWTDREGSLPRTGANGNPVHYTEWDVNEKQPGQTRDAERIVTGDDGTAWYTGDHYARFCQMR